MAEKNLAAVEEEQPKKKSGGGFKEWRRKQIINLKRKPQNIAFLLVIITTAYNLLTLGTYSEALQKSGANSNVDWVGLMVFVNTLFSLLTVVAFMNSFPKMKKPPKLVKNKKTGEEVLKENKTIKTVNFTKASKIYINIVMMVVFLVFMLVMIACECIYFTTISDFKATSLSDSTAATEAALIANTMTLSIVHIVLLAIDIVMYLLVPVTGKLLAKIDTSKELESAVSNMQEIDLASED